MIRRCKSRFFLNVMFDSKKKLKKMFSFKARNLRNMDKPLLRKKSELPQDSGVAKALTNYKRADEFLKTTPDTNKC